MNLYIIIKNLIFLIWFLSMFYIFYIIFEKDLNNVIREYKEKIKSFILKEDEYLTLEELRRRYNDRKFTNR